jgi:hypothetical protein
LPKAILEAMASGIHAYQPTFLVVETLCGTATPGILMPARNGGQRPFPS